MEKALRQGHEELNAGALNSSAYARESSRSNARLNGLYARLLKCRHHRALWSQSASARRNCRPLQTDCLNQAPVLPGAFAVSRLTKMRELISHPKSADLARAVLAEHFGTFTLEPTIQDGEPVYLAHGKVDFFGDEAMAQTGGARSPYSTTRAYRFSLPLAA